MTAKRLARRCAFLSMDNLDGFCSYDDLVTAPLATLGWAVESVPWRSTTDWAQYEVVVIRTPWDYYLAPHEFMATLRSIASSTRLENPLPVIDWNLDKRYLLDLASRGVPIVPTVVAGTVGEAEAAYDALRNRHARIILKPLISANASRTHLLDSSKSLPELDGSAGWLIQPFLEQITREGEVSLFYFGGDYSHAIVKRPAQGDFRVQEEHGGRLARIEPQDDLLRAGRNVIDAVGQPLLYARVDLVRHDNRWLLMELELIEPSLYFNMDPSSPERFARAFVHWIDTR